VHRRFRNEIIDTLRVREEGSSGEILESLLDTLGPMEQEKLLTLANLSPREAQETIDNMKQTGQVLSLGGRDFATMIVSVAGWRRLVARVTQVMQGYHQQFPLRRGMPREELRSRLSLTEDVFALLLLRLLKEEILSADGLMLSLSGFRPDLSQEEQIAVDAFIAELERNPFSPSSEAVLSPELLNWLVQQQRVVKVSADVIFAASAYSEMVARVTDYINSHGSVTVAQVRDLFGTSRKYALALMEHLDKQKITRRVGDERVLR
jgi:selenocysteine-specific elongation factor